MIKRFYLYKEGTYKTDSDLKVRFLGPRDFKYIENEIMDFWFFMRELMNGNRCLALIKDGTVLTFLWVSDKLNYYGYKRELKPNECHLCNAITKPDVRGGGYAGILRAKAYEILRGQGKDTFYSITELNNKPALRFKEKIGAEKIGKFTYIKFLGYDGIFEHQEC